MVLEQLANRTAQNIRQAIALANAAVAVQQAAADTRQEAVALCRFSALERRRRATLASREAKRGLLSYFVL